MERVLYFIGIDNKNLVDTNKNLIIKNYLESKLIRNSLTSKKRLKLLKNGRHKKDNTF